MEQKEIRFIYPGAGSPRGDGPDFWVSTSSPTMVLLLEEKILTFFGKNHTVQLTNEVDGIICLVTHHLHGMATV